MQIIYDTIRERKSQLDEQKQKRKVRLQGDAIALMSEFKQSLFASGWHPFRIIRN